MKAGVLRAINQIRCEDVPVPVIGEEDILLAVKQAGICGSDYGRVLKTGTWRFPTVLGHEFAGVVAEVGRNVNGVSAGDRVVVNPMVSCAHCKYCYMGERSLCESYDYIGSRSDGGFAEFARVPATNVIHIPDNLDWDDAVSTDPITVSLHAVRIGQIKIGETVVVIGCGPIGDYIIQWAKIAGSTMVVAVDVIPEKLDIAKKIGADYCFNAMDQEWMKHILELTDGVGVNLSFEASGSLNGLTSCIDITAKKGRVVCVGTPHADVKVNGEAFERILRGEINITGSWCYNYTQLPVDEWKTTLYFQSNKKIQVQPVITHRFPLEEVDKAFALIRDKTEFFNKIVIIA